MAIGPQQLAELLRCQGPPLALYARIWCEDADDVVQEALIRLASQPQAPVDPVAWLYRAVRNLALSAVRSDRRRRQREALVATERASWFQPVDGQQLDAQAATEALAGLPPEQREVIVARIWGQLSFEQIAELTSSSRSTVHRRYTAGLDALRTRFPIHAHTE